MPRELSKTLFLGFAAAVTASSAVQGGEIGGIDLQAGGMAVVAPKYEGAKDYRVVGFPFVAPGGTSSNGFVQFKGPDDLRFRVLSGGGFEAGPLVGWRFSRDEDDAARLVGLGDVDGSVVVGGFAAYSMGALRLFTSYHHGVTGDDDTGALLRFGSEARTMIGGIPIQATVGANWADDSYMDAYFSVSPQQSARSAAGLRSYDAEAGIKNVYLGLSTDVPLTERWTLKLMGQYAHLVGDAADSPIVESESQFTGGAGLTYRFHISP